ncbi:SRPBCC family protein [Acerihabitans arboris]|uniref:Polyketide cyclase n=1 Tax=Acerihabitans arboris TaxID=2691583 RepID=A0A845SP88_9GAMM|nr:polyketide cyclase [Acerihabitans arboris]NDL63005.1 polyketide cyclase [Acerihabitans arboris]
MTNPKTENHANELLFEYVLDASPEKVWRALSIPALREKWLPDVACAQSEPISSTPEAEICYRMRDDEEPPFLESRVTLQIRPNDMGGTILTIIHRLPDARLNGHSSAAANDDACYLMLAA